MTSTYERTPVRNAEISGKLGLGAAFEGYSLEKSPGAPYTECGAPDAQRADFIVSSIRRLSSLTHRGMMNQLALRAYSSLPESALRVVPRDINAQNCVHLWQAM